MAAIPKYTEYTVDGEHFFKTRAALLQWQRETGIGIRRRVVEVPKEAENPLYRLGDRGPVCEECNKRDAGAYCVDCDELLCQMCKELTHLMADAAVHLLFDYPVIETEADRARREEYEALVREKEEEKARKIARMEAARREAEEARIAAIPKPAYVYPKFKHGDKVVFYTAEGSGRAREVVGRVQPAPEGQLRRSAAGVFWYRVKWDDYYAPEAQTAEGGRIVRTQLVSEAEMEFEFENQRRKMAAAVNAMTTAGVRRGWVRWMDVLEYQRWLERRSNAALRIQRMVRGAKGRAAAMLLRYEKQKERDRLARIHAKAQRKKRRARARQERRTKAKSEGITTDGVHFFMTFAELHAWVRVRQAAAAKMQRVLWRAHAGRGRVRGFNTWKEFVEASKAKEAHESNHLKDAQEALKKSEQVSKKRTRGLMAKLKMAARMTGNVKAFQMTVHSMEIPLIEGSDFEVEAETSTRGSKKKTVKKIKSAKSKLRMMVRMSSGGNPFGGSEKGVAAGGAGGPPESDAGSVSSDGDSSAAETASDGESGNEAKGRSAAMGRLLAKPGSATGRRWGDLTKAGGGADGGGDGERGEGGTPAAGSAAAAVLAKRGPASDTPEDKASPFQFFFGKDSSTIEQEAAVPEDAITDPNTNVGPWHPAIGISSTLLPALASMGAGVNLDGSLRVEDIVQYKAFLASMRGPCDTSNWVIRGSLLMGTFPEGQAYRTNKAITQRSSAAAQILMANVGTFICLMTEEELAAHDRAYEDIVREKAREIRSAMHKGVQAAAKAYNRTSQAYAKAESYAPKIREEMRKRMEADRAVFHAAEVAITNFPTRINFVHFPIPDGGTVPDADLLGLSEALEERLRNGDRMFIFSRAGRGRAGQVCAMLIARLYGLTAHAAVRRVQRAHDARSRHEPNPVRAKPLNLPRIAFKQPEASREEKRYKALKSVNRDEPGKNAFFGTSFSRFGRKNEAQEEEKALGSVAKKRAVLPWLKERPKPKVDPQSLAVPATAEQVKQLARVLARYNEPIYDSVETNVDPATAAKAGGPAAPPAGRDRFYTRKFRTRGIPGVPRVASRVPPTEARALKEAALETAADTRLSDRETRVEYK